MAGRVSLCTQKQSTLEIFHLVMVSQNRLTDLEMEVMIREGISLKSLSDEVDLF